MRKKETLPEINAANSWFVEGVATFCETNSLGEANERWLNTLQEMIKKDAVYPLEQLTVYKMGSFPGVYRDAMLYAYAQSWAFVTFLMHTYPDQFMNYLERISKEAPKENEDLNWLLEALGKDLKVLQFEFMEFIKKYEPTEDPDVKYLNKMRQIFESF